MPKALDLTNKRFGKLVAIAKAPNKGNKTYWLCQCDCGNEKEVQTSHLTNGSIQSCGKCNQNSKNVIDRRIRIKKALVEANQCKCAYCGLEDDYRLYDFHHINPDTKLFQISGSTKGQETIADEAEKCVMLCANCHRRVENGLIPNDFEIIFDKEKFFYILSNLK